LLRTVPRAPQVRIETHSAAAVCAFVAEGLGVSVLPALLAVQFIDKALVLKTVEVPIRHRFVVGCATSLQRSPLVEEFARTARGAAKALVDAARIDA
jgi:DNA-binding transcriptional LysR family regulator